MKKMILEEEVLLTDKKVFGDNNEHCYEVECYDGYGIAHKAEDSNAPETLKMTYPKRKDVLADDELCDLVREYRGLYDVSKKDIHYGDILMALGVIEK